MSQHHGPCTLWDTPEKRAEFQRMLQGKPAMKEVAKTGPDMDDIAELPGGEAEGGYRALVQNKLVWQDEPTVSGAYWMRWPGNPVDVDVVRVTINKVSPAGVAIVGVEGARYFHELLGCQFLLIATDPPEFVHPDSHLRAAIGVSS